MHVVEGTSQASKVDMLGDLVLFKLIHSDLCEMNDELNKDGKIIS